MCKNRSGWMVKLWGETPKEPVKWVWFSRHHDVLQAVRGRNYGGRSAEFSCFQFNSSPELFYRHDEMKSCFFKCSRWTSEFFKWDRCSNDFGRRSIFPLCFLNPGFAVFGGCCQPSDPSLLWTPVYLLDAVPVCDEFLRVGWAVCRLKTCLNKKPHTHTLT